MKPVINRMRRLRGQLQKLEEGIEAEESCTEVITQFLAVKGAINGAFEAYIKEVLAECANRDESERNELITALTRF